MLDTVFQDYVDSLKFVFFNKMKTNNPIVDAILTTLALSSFGYLLQLYQTYKSSAYESMMNYGSSIFPKPSKLTVSGRHCSAPSNFGDYIVTSVYSDRFVSLLDYIIHHVHTDSVREVKELFANYNNDLRKTSDHLVVSQNKPFLIDTDIYVQMKFIVEKLEDNKKLISSEEIQIEVYSYVYDIQYITQYVDKIMLNYRKTLNDCRKTKQFIYTAIKTSVAEDESRYNKWNEEVFFSNRHFDNLFLENKKQLLSRIDFFLNNKEWYDERGIPYNLGIGLHGAPGTGKTSFIKALANKTKRDIVVIPLSLVKTKSELSDLFYESTYNTKNDKQSKGFDKKIIVFEDIDCIGDVVKNRETKNKKIANSLKQYEDALKKTNGGATSLLPMVPDYFTLDDFLNLWDGVLETPGRIIVITSNFYEELDPALIRPGRIDITYEFKNVNHVILQEIHEKFYGKTMDNADLQKIREYFYSPADVINFYMTFHDNETEYIRRLQDNQK